MALACCACELVPASLFYRPCLSRRRWHPSGDFRDSWAHLGELPSWLFDLFGGLENRDGPGPDLGASSDTSSVSESDRCAPHDHGIVINGGFRQTRSTSQGGRDSPSLVENARNRQSQDLEAEKELRIPIEVVGVRPECVGSLRTCYLVLSSELWSLLRCQVVAIATLEGIPYFALGETWKEVILRTASEKVRVQVWILLVTLTTYSTPTPYAEPLWQIFHTQLEEVTEKTIIPFLSVLDLTDFKAWGHEMHRYVYIADALDGFLAYEAHSSMDRDLLLLVIYRRVYAGTSSTPCLPFGLEISQYLHISSPIERLSLISVMLFVEGLDRLMLDPGVSQASLIAHLDSCSPNILNDQYTRFLIFISMDSTICLQNNAQSANNTSILRDWWKANRVTDGCTTDTITEVLWQSRSASRIIPVQSIEGLDSSVRSALAFALAQRQYLSQAQSVLEGCLVHARNAWPADSPTRSLLYTELVNCSNALGYEAQGESSASQALAQADEPHLAYRFDTICLKIALADSYIGQRKYSIACELLVDIVEHTTLSDGLYLRATLRLSKARRRLARQEATSVANTELLKDLLGRSGNVLQSLKLEYLEEAYSVIVDTSRLVSSAYAVRDLLHDFRANNVEFPGAPEDWRVSAIEAALDSDAVPHDEIFNNGDDGEVDRHQGAPYTSQNGPQPLEPVTIRVLVIRYNRLSDELRKFAIFEGDHLAFCTCQCLRWFRGCDIRDRFYRFAHCDWRCRVKCSEDDKNTLRSRSCLLCGARSA